MPRTTEVRAAWREQQAADAARTQRLLILLATWYDLWEVLERVAPGRVSRLTGHPFTAAADPTAVLAVDCHALQPTDAPLLRRAASLWGGRWCPTLGRLTHCHLGMRADQWRLFVC